MHDTKDLQTFAGAAGAIGSIAAAAVGAVLAEPIVVGIAAGAVIASAVALVRGLNAPDTRASGSDVDSSAHC